MQNLYELCTAEEKRKLLHVDLRKKVQSKITSFCLRFSATVITGTKLTYFLHVQHAMYPNVSILIYGRLFMNLNIYTFTEFLASFWNYDTVATTSQMSLVYISFWPKVYV